MSQSQLHRVQQELEQTVEALKTVTDTDERKSLLKKMRRLIDEADRMLAESQSE